MVGQRGLAPSKYREKDGSGEKGAENREYDRGIRIIDSRPLFLSQADELILITDNRNDESPDSLNSTIRSFNTSQSLPVFTIADLDKFGVSREYEKRVVGALYDYLLRIDEVRGTGRLFLP